MKLLAKINRLPATERGAALGIGATALIPFAANLFTGSSSSLYTHAEELGLGLGLSTAAWLYAKKRNKKAAMWTAGFSLATYAVEKFIFSPKDL